MYSEVPGWTVSGINQAAKAISITLNKAAKEIHAQIKDQEYDEKRLGIFLGQVYKKHVSPVLSEYSDLGATDTEPRHATAQALINVVKNWYGISGWTNLGDYI